MNKEKQALIIRKYLQYLKLEKSLSINTQEAYKQDLDKLLHYLKSEQTGVLEVSMQQL